jgi:hypothetical protein
MPDLLTIFTGAAAIAGFAVAVVTGVLAWQTGRLADETRTATKHEQDQLELLRRDRDLRLRPILEFHDCSVGPAAGPQGTAVLTVSNYGQGLAVRAFCVGQCQDRTDQRLPVNPYMSVRTVHIRPGAENFAIALGPADDAARHAALLEPTPGGPSEQRGDGRYAVFCLDETGRTLYRFLFGQPAVDRWVAGEPPPPPWAVPLLRRVPELTPAGADLNRLLNP